MADVKLLCDKSFSDVDREIVDSFIDFQQALIDKDIDKLDEVILDCDDFINLVGNQSKDEFIRDISDDTLKFLISELLDPTVLFDDENNASLTSKVRLTVEIKGKKLRLITDSTVSLQKVDGKWLIGKWDS